MSDSKNRKLGVIISYASIVINTLIQLIYLPFLIKMLGQSEYGLYSLINSIVGYLTVLDLGFGNAIVVYTAKYRAQKKYEEEKKLHGMFLIVFFVIALIAGVCGFILFLNVDNIFGSTMTTIELYKSKIMMLILTFNLVITFIFNIYSSILNAYEKFVYKKIISLIGTILKPLLMIPFLFLGFKSITMVIIITIINIFTLLSDYIYCKNKLDIKIKFMGFDKKIFKIIFGYSIWIFLGSIVNKINWSVDQFVLGAVSGTIAVSIYSVSNSLSSLFLNMSTVVSNLFLPKVTKMIEKNATTTELTNEMIKIGRIQFFFFFLASSGLILFGKDFIVLWVGEKFIQSYYVTLILVIPLCFTLIQNIGLSIMQAMGKFKFYSIVTLIMAIINVIMSVFLAKMYGAIGSSIGTALSLILCNIIVINIFYYKNMKLDIVRFWKEIIKIIYPCILPFVIVFILQKHTNFNAYINIIFYGMIYVLIYSMVNYHFNMNDYERDLLKSVFNKLKIWKKSGNK